MHTSSLSSSVHGTQNSEKQESSLITMHDAVSMHMSGGSPSHSLMKQGSSTHAPRFGSPSHRQPSCPWHSFIASISLHGSSPVVVGSPSAEPSVTDSVSDSEVEEDDDDEDDDDEEDDVLIVVGSVLPVTSDVSP